MKDKEKRILHASAVSISEIQPSDIYMSITMRMFSTRPNRNNEAVTEAFIDEIVANQTKYICVPLCADTRKMVRNDYGGLGHMLNPETETFMSEQIGGFVSFKKVYDEYGISLYGEARVPKRDERVCNTLIALYEMGKLNFSFEILAGDMELKNGVWYIDASPNNTLFGMAVVSVPAYPEAKALALVAETKDESGRGFTLSEATFYTLRNLLSVKLEAFFGDAWPWSYTVERMCHECIILYNEMDGRTVRVDYQVIDDNPIITDVYEVVYQRKGDVRMNLVSSAGLPSHTHSIQVEQFGTVEEVSAVEQTPNIEATVAQTGEQSADGADGIPAVETVEVAESEVPASDTASIEPTPDAETPEVTSEVAEVETVEVSENKGDEAENIAPEGPIGDVGESGPAGDVPVEDVTELKAELEQLRAQVASLQKYQAIAESAEAERLKNERSAKKAQMMQFAQKNGLDTEKPEIAEIIERLDYEALVTCSVSETPVKKTEPKPAISSFTMFNGMELEGEYGGILRRVQQ